MSHRGLHVQTLQIGNTLCSLRNLQIHYHNWVLFVCFKEGERVFSHFFLFSESTIFFEGQTKLAGLKEGVFTFFLESLLIRKKNLLFKPILKLEKGLLPKTSHLPTFSC